MNSSQIVGNFQRAQPYSLSLVSSARYTQLARTTTIEFDIILVIFLDHFFSLFLFTYFSTQTLSSSFLLNGVNSSTRLPVRITIRMQHQQHHFVDRCLLCVVFSHTIGFFCCCICLPFKHFSFSLLSARSVVVANKKQRAIAFWLNAMNHHHTIGYASRARRLFVII